MMSKREILELFVEKIWDCVLLKTWTQVIAEGYIPTPRATFGIFGQSMISHFCN